MLRPTLPPVSDTIGIVEHVRRRGWIDFPLQAVPDDFVGWRRNIRVAAKRLDMRVSVIRSGELVSVHDPDHEPPEDERRATIEVMSSMTSALLNPTGQPSKILSMEDAMHAQRRTRLRIVDEK